MRPHRAHASEQQRLARFGCNWLNLADRASVVLQLVEENRLALTDSVERWLPGVLPANGDASIEHLLRLESGIFDFARDERHMAPYLQGEWDHARTSAELVRLAADHPPDFPAGAG